MQAQHVETRTVRGRTVTLFDLDDLEPERVLVQAQSRTVRLSHVQTDIRSVVGCSHCLFCPSQAQRELAFVGDLCRKERTRELHELVGEA